MHNTQYNNDFKVWLDENALKIKRILFTGMYDGGRENEMRPAGQEYARAYYSGLAGKTPTEIAIEEALSFEGDGRNPDFPHFELLSMNAGHATELSGIVRRANEGKNANSLVLRLATQKYSVLFTGDAEGPTWNHILTHTTMAGRNIPTDYVILSHHGSKEGGAARKDVLDYLQPKGCFISAGRHSRYSHPTQETLGLVMSLTSLWTTDHHTVSYFGPDSDDPRRFVYKRKGLRKAIFSTLNSGKLTLDLSGGLSVQTSQAKETIYQGVGGGIGASSMSARSFGVNYDSVYYLQEGQTMVAALEELIQQLRAAKTNLTLWQKTAPTDKQVVVRNIPIQNVEYTPHLHVLVEDTKGRFYFLEELEEEGREAASQAFVAKG